jgi:hypothetical protein
MSDIPGTSRRDYNERYSPSLADFLQLLVSDSDASLTTPSGGSRRIQSAWPKMPKIDNYR